MLDVVSRSRRWPESASTCLTTGAATRDAEIVREVRRRAIQREVTDAALAQLSGYFLGAAMTRRIFFAQDGAWFGSLPETQGPSDSALLATKAQSAQGFP